MENWIILGISGYFCYALSCITDKYYMNKNWHILSTNFLKMIFDGIILLTLGILFFDFSINTQIITYTIPLGFLYAISGIFYFNALKFNDAETVIPIFQSLKILLIFTLSIFLFQEPSSTINSIGIIILLIGVYGVLSKNKLQIPKINKSFGFILGTIIVNVIYSLWVKKLLFQISPINLAVTMYFWTAFFLGTTLLLIPKQRKKFKLKHFKIVLASITGSVGTLLIYSALSIGFASKVYSLAGTESVFVFILAWLFLKEKFYWSRLAGTIAVFIGIYLIAI